MNSWNRYGVTAARTHGRPGRAVRPATVTVDIHAHVSVPAAAELAMPYLDPMSIPAVKYATGETRELNRRQELERGGRMSGVEERLREMDDMGVDVQVVSPSPAQIYFGLPPEPAIAAIGRLNDGIAELVARRPDRLRAFGTVPLQEPEAAVAELERVTKSHGFRGVEILTSVAGRELSDPAFETFWSKAAELDALVMIHPMGFTEGRRLSRFYFNNVIGNPLDTTVAVHHLIFDGVLERYPALKILAVHGGGFAAAYAARMDHAWGARSDARGTLPRPPTQYLKLFYFDTIVFSPGQLEALMQFAEAGHVLMGTDYPFDMAEYDPIGHIASVGSIDEETRAALAGGNAARLLGIGA